MRNDYSYGPTLAEASTIIFDIKDNAKFTPTRRTYTVDTNSYKTFLNNIRRFRCNRH